MIYISHRRHATKTKVRHQANFSVTCTWYLVLYTCILYVRPEIMPPKRRSETICDSTLLTIAVVVPVAVSLYLYRREPKKLFQILFGVFVSFMVFVMLKHLWKIVSARWKSKEEDVNPGLSHMLIRPL